MYTGDALKWAVFSAVQHVRANAITDRTLPTGTRVLRGVSNDWAERIDYKSPWQPGHINPEHTLAARTPRNLDGQRSKYRWTGRLSHEIVQWGLYAALDNGALTAELSHYYKGKHGDLPDDRATKSPDATALFNANGGPSTLCRFRTTRLLLMADLTNRGGGQRFFEEVAQLIKDGDPRASLKGSWLKDKALDAGNYDISQAVGIALGTRRQPSYDGIIVETARPVNDPGYDGSNTIFFGPAGTPLPYLEFECVLEITPKGRGKATVARLP